MTLATLDQVEALLQINITNPVDPMALTLLELATAVVEGEVGRVFATDEITDEAHTTPTLTGAVLLDHWPVAEVGEVTESGEVLTVDVDYRAELRAGIVRRVVGSSFGYWAPTPAAILVTYTPAIPAELAALAAQITARAFKAGQDNAAAPAVMAGLRQLTIGRWSATRETGRAGLAAGEALTLTDAEVRVAHRYRERRL